MTRHDLILAALSVGGQGVRYEPVQVQKLFFLIDREIPHLVDGPHFRFRPYDYGPFDSAVYTELENLSKLGLVQIVAGYYRSYALTHEGAVRGASALSNASGPARDFIGRADQWVRSLTFSQLVSAIYKKYPEMKSASVFRDE